MQPARVVRAAKSCGLDGIGIADHNSAENVAATKAAGHREGLAVLGGMEISSREEVHVLGFFDDDAALTSMQELVYGNLPGRNDVTYFGHQTVVDEAGAVVAENPRLLIGATTLTLEDVVNSIHERGGVAIASHIDRGSFSVTSQLGFIPPDVSFDAVEVSQVDLIDADGGVGGVDLGRVDGAPGAAVVVSSDAHFPRDIGRCATRFALRQVSVAEIQKACCRRDGRTVAGYDG